MEKISRTSDRESFTSSDWSLIALIGIIWGASFLLIAISLRHFHPGLVTWMRVGLGALTLMMLPGSRKPIDKSDGSKIIWISILWTAIPFTLFPLAETHINSAITGLLNGGTPIFSGIIGALFFARKVGSSLASGIAAGFIGIAIISFASAAHSESAVIGIVMVLFATFCYGISTNLAGSLLQKYGSLPVMANMLGWAAIFTTPYGLYDLARSSFAWDSLIANFVLGVFGTGVAYALMGTLVGRVGATRATFVTYVIPVISLFLGVVFLHDVVSPLALIGVALVVSGVALASRKEN